MSTRTLVYCDRCKCEVGPSEPLYHAEIVGRRKSCKQDDRSWHDLCGACASPVSMALKPIEMKDVAA